MVPPSQLGAHRTMMTAGTQIKGRHYMRMTEISATPAHTKCRPISGRLVATWRGHSRGGAAQA
jgi:hypothetical protein